MIGDLLPAEIAVADILGEDLGAFLLPEEEPLVARAVDSRRREVTNARTCARRALRELGRPERPILRGEKGEPLWPAGVVGSITHTKGYFAAAVAESAKIRSIGIDAESNGELPEGVLAHVAFGPELDWVAELGNSGGIWWDRLLFSAKESVYKAWFPLTRRWLGFEDARVTVDPVDGTFEATLLVDASTVDGPPLGPMSGRYQVSNGYVLTALVIPPS